MGELSKCPNCDYDLGYVPKWVPGETCPNCGYSPPKWPYWFMALALFPSGYIGYWISRKFLGNTAIGNLVLSIILMLVVVRYMSSVMTHLKKKFGWFQNIK